MWTLSARLVPPRIAPLVADALELRKPPAPTEYAPLLLPANPPSNPIELARLRLIPTPKSTALIAVLLATPRPPKRPRAIAPLLAMATPPVVNAPLMLLADALPRALAESTAIAVPKFEPATAVECERAPHPRASEFPCAIAMPPWLEAMALPVATPPRNPDPFIRASANPPPEADAMASIRVLPTPDALERATPPLEKLLDVTCPLTKLEAKRTKVNVVNDVKRFIAGTP